MPREFVARNGIISLSSSFISGALTVTQGITGSLFGTASWAINSLTASYLSGSSLTSSYALTASSADNFTVRGTLTAQTIVAQVITSSTEYITGSTQFGSTVGNTHQFTGSVSVSGALSVNGSSVISSAQTSSMSVLSSSYAVTSSYPLLGVITGSVNVNTLTFTKGDGSSFNLTVSQSGSVATASYALFAETSSKSTSSSYALTASYAMNAGGATTSGSFTGSFLGTASWASQSVSASYALSSSYALTASYVSVSAIQYVTDSIQSLTQIEVADYDNNVAVTYVNGKLKFIFGAPTSQSITSFTFNSTFATDRFNQVLDDYTASAAWSNGGYTLVSASITEGTTLLAQTGTGTSLNYSASTSGSHTYTLYVTASSPLDSSLVIRSSSLAGTLSKSNPGTPSISATASVQLGGASNQIEQGATGSIAFSASWGATNSWYTGTLALNPTGSLYSVTGSATGSTSIVFRVTASYYSPPGTNVPDLTYSASNTYTFTKIRSLRGGASESSSFIATDLENISIWDTSLGGTIGTISKGTLNPSGQSVSINWTGDKYHYIVYDSSYAYLTNITAAGFGVLSAFTSSSIGNYKVYRTSVLQSGYSGQSITYALT